MLLKAGVLFAAINVAYGCSPAIVNAIIEAVQSGPPVTTMGPLPTSPGTTMKPATTLKPVTIPTTNSTTCKCGNPNRATKIVNGVQTEANEYPWQVGLARPGYTPFCGGSIISSKSILTAAHCTAGKSPGDFIIIIGAHNAWTTNMKATVCAINDHADYDADTYNFDYSVLTLCSPLTFNREVSPVCLPTTTDSSMYEFKQHTVTGWGTTSSGGDISQYLMEVDVMTMSNAVCCDGITNKYSCSELTKYMMCASAPTKDSCQGDSGGPLITMGADGQYVQTGVVSWGIGCANPSYPGVYARTVDVMDWIKSYRVGETCVA